jgi:predicted AAA+ superfamily ATPase
MEELFDFLYRQLQKIDLSFQRYLTDEIVWDGRLSAITGARGTGKTTMILQHIKQTCIKSRFLLHISQNSRNFAFFK